MPRPNSVENFRGARYLLIAMLGIGSYGSPGLAAQATSGEAPTAPSPPRAASSDTLILAAESDTILSRSKGVSGSVQWLHSISGRYLILAGVSSTRQGPTLSTLGLGGLVLFRGRWIVDSSIRAGVEHSSGVAFPFRDFTGSVTYKLSPHLLPSFKEEFVDVATSHGSLLRGAFCFCNLHHVSTTVSLASSAFGNLATEYVSLREERASRRAVPFVEISRGQILPMLVDPGLGIRTPAAQLISVSGGVKLLPSRPRNVSIATSYSRAGRSATLSFSISISMRFRGE